MNIFKGPSLYWFALRVGIYLIIFSGIWYGGNFYIARELLTQLQVTSPNVIFIDQNILNNTYFTDLHSKLFDKPTNILLRKYGQNLLSPQTGSFTFPFATISDGVDFAKANNISTIIIASGTYTESIIVPDNVLIFGQGNVKITYDTTSLKNVIQTSDHSTLLNLHVSGGASAIMIPHNTSTTLINVIASDASDFGILMDKKDRTPILNKFQIEQPVYEIENATDEQISNIPLIRLHHVTIKNNKNQGLYLRDGRIIIDDCYVTDNGEEGIDLHPHMVATITNTTSTMNGESGLESEIYDNRVTITNSIFDNNIKSGVAFLTALGTGKITIRDTQLTNNQQYGIRCAVHTNKPLRPRPYFSSVITKENITFTNNDVGNVSSPCLLF